MRRKIFIKQWLELKPYEIQTSTDGYYIKLSNDIKSTLLDEGLFVLLRYLNDEEINLLSCFLVSYFEDIISETNIWTSFINIHNKLYKKKLPFYNTDTYFDGEINEQDISFLIWYFLNTIQGDKFISPFNNFIEDLASQVMLIFEKEYEYAPENKRLKTYYTIDKNETDYYVVRNLIDIILFKTYLYFFDTSFKLKQQEQELIEKNDDDDESLLMILRDNRDSLVHKSCTRLLSLKGKEWASEILGAKHAVGVNLFNMSQRVVGYFFYKGQDKFDIFIEHIASGKRFNLTKKSFEYYSDLQEIVLYIWVLFVGQMNGGFPG